MNLSQFASIWPDWCRECSSPWYPPELCEEDGHVVARWRMPAISLRVMPLDPWSEQHADQIMQAAEWQANEARGKYLGLVIDETMSPVAACEHVHRELQRWAIPF